MKQSAHHQDSQGAINQEALVNPLRAPGIKVRIGRTSFTQMLGEQHIKEIFASSDPDPQYEGQAFKLSLEHFPTTIPLNKAFKKQSVLQSGVQRRKDRDEIGDVKIYLLDGKQVVARTQVPIWSIPVLKEISGTLKPQEDPPESSSSDDEQEPGTEFAGNAETAKAISDSLERPKDKHHVSKATWKWDAFNAMVGALRAPSTSKAADLFKKESGNLGKTSKDPSQVSPLSHDAGLMAQEYAPAFSAPPKAGLPPVPTSSSTPPKTGLPPAPTSSSVRPKAVNYTTLPPTSLSTDGSGSISTHPPTGSLPHSTLDPPLMTGLSMMHTFIDSHCGPFGRHLKRKMESISESYVKPPVMELSICITPLKPKDSNLQVEQIGALLQNDVKDEESDDEGENFDNVVPIPINPLPPLSVLVALDHVNCKPDKVFEMLFDHESTFTAKMREFEELTDVVEGQWTPDATLAASSGFLGAKSRTIRYIRPLSIPLPMAPKKCNVTEQQSLIIRESGGFVVEIKVTANAPKGDTFFVLIQWMAMSEGVFKSQVRVSFKVEFIKSVGFLKGAIESGAVSNTKKLMLKWMEILVKEVELQSHIKKEALQCNEEVESLPVVEQPLAPSTMTQLSTGSKDWRILGLNASLTDIILAILILTMLLVALGIWGMLRSMNSLTKTLELLAQQDKAWHEQMIQYVGAASSWRQGPSWAADHETDAY